MTSAPITGREPSLLTRQWTDDPAVHAARKNLLIHIVTVPLFWIGLATLIAGIARGSWVAAAGPMAMALAIALQGRGHRFEAQKPAPFRGPVDVLLRLIAEQLVTFPRFVFSGGFARAWREAA